MVNKHPNDSIQNQLYNGEEDNRKNQKNKEGKAANCVNALMIFCAVAITDQRHYTLGNANTDMQRDSSAFGRYSIGSRQDIAAFRAKKQTI